jgi:hypothetical protein
MLQVILHRGARRALAGTAAALVTGLVAASGAYADTTPSVQGYSGPGGQTQCTVDQGTTPPGTQTCSTPSSQVPQGGVQPTTAQGVLPATSGGNIPAGGNEVLGASQSGGSLPAGANGAAPAAATAPSVASNRLVRNLPFTGLDLAMVAAVGLALAGLGFGLRRMTRAPQAS